MGQGSAFVGYSRQNASVRLHAGNDSHAAMAEGQIVGVPVVCLPRCPGCWLVMRDPRNG